MSARDIAIIERVAAKLRRPVEQRFWQFVSPEPTSGCWLWTGNLSSRGYAKIGINRRSHNATHIALTMAGRPVPRGLFALHKCDNRACVNPDHLFHGSARDNTRDMWFKARGVLPPARRGEANPKARLTEVAVLAMRAEARAGVNLRDIARKYRVGFTAAAEAVRGDNWTHLPGAVPYKWRRGHRGGAQ